MSDRPYSRVYWTVVDDPKFETIYDNDNHLAAWLRMLLIADQAFPASGQIPSNARKASVRALAEVGLIDLSGGRFRIRGLDAERTRRAASARVGGLASGRSRSVEQTLNDLPTSKRTKSNLDEDETRTRRDEHSAREGLPNLDQGAIRALEHRTGRTWGQAGEKQLTEYDRLIEDHGLERVLSAMDRLITDGKPMTARQLVWGAMKVLEPMVPVQSLLKEDADQERQEERDRNSRRGVEATQRYLADLRATGSREAS